MMNNGFRLKQSTKQQILKDFKGKTIIFAAPTNFGFSDVIKVELERLGFHVYDFSHLVTIPFRYKNIWRRLHNCCRKVFYSDYENKQRLLREFRDKNFFDKLDVIPCVDYFFSIRPDFFPLNFVDKARAKAKFSVAYQWDGMQRFPEVLKYVSRFDRFFVFDPEDCSIPNTSLITNFCIGEAEQGDVESDKSTPHSYFVGSYVEERFDEVVALEEALSQVRMENHFYIFSNVKEEIKKIEQHNFRHINTTYSYDRNIEMVKDAFLLVDVHNPVHKGLSFRAFEALNFGKKLITTNASIKEYDFYRPENIFVWGVDDASRLEDFIKAPLVDIEASIKGKYYFENWIKNVLIPKDDSTNRRFGDTEVKEVKARPAKVLAV